MATMILQVTGMKCGGCESSVKTAVQSCAGVESVTASHKENSVEVQYDAATADPEVIRKAIRDKGFAVA